MQALILKPNRKPFLLKYMEVAKNYLVSLTLNHPKVFAILLFHCVLGTDDDFISIPKRPWYLKTNFPVSGRGKEESELQCGELVPNFKV